MESGVLFEATKSRVLLRTPLKVAPKLFVARVNYQVGLKVPLGNELGLAVAANERSFTRVGSDVCL